jgi:hypothetical protein
MAALASLLSVDSEPAARRVRPDSRRWLKPPGWHLQRFGLSLTREGQRRRMPRVKGGCGGIGSLCRDRLLDELVETLTTSADVHPPDECPL